MAAVLLIELKFDVSLMSASGHRFQVVNYGLIMFNYNLHARTTKYKSLLVPLLLDANKVFS